MTKYRINYKLLGVGNFFVEAPSIAQAYERMYRQFQNDNSLIVHAKYPYGFEILDGGVFEQDFPTTSKILVTTIAQLRQAEFDGLPLGTNEPDPVIFAETGLFEFDDGPVEDDS